MLIPVTFKNNDTETVKTKVGKVSTQTARMLYANTFSDKVGIVKGYKKDDNTEELSIIGATPVGDEMMLTFNKGAVSIYGGIGIIEQGTTVNVPQNITDYSFGIVVNLGNQAGSEMKFYCKPSGELRQDDLQINDVDGVYEFELFKITTTASTANTSSKTTKYIYSVNDFLELKLKNLGFNEGNIAFTGGETRYEGTLISSVSFSDIARNEFKRQASLVVANFNLKFSAYSAGGETITVANAGTIPKEFIPTEDISMSVGTNTYLTFKTNGTIVFETQAGYGGYASGSISKQHLGYQAQPLN